MDPVKLGYVGCGFMAQKVHIPNFLRISECDLVAIAEVRAELGQKVQDRYRVPKLYKDHLELAKDSEIEAVAVSADFALQGEIAKDLLSAGKCVFMEKPMAVSIKQAESLLETAKSANTKLMVGYMKRYDAGNELVKLNVTKFRQTKELGHIQFDQLVSSIVPFHITNHKLWVGRFCRFQQRFSLLNRNSHRLLHENTFACT
jgi:predicted dehydrogenase